MSRMTKRALLRSAVLGGGAGALAAAVGAPLWARAAAAQQTVTGVTYLTPAYEALMWGIQGFVERLRENGGDALNVEFYDSGQLLKADEQTPALRSGAIDFMFHTTSYITRSFEILGITGLPSLVEELYEHGDRIAMETPLWRLINDELAKDNIYMLTAGGGIMQPEYVWSTDANRIASLDDLSGKRIRVVGYEASTALEKLGVAPVRIPSSETYLALQRGTVDAVVANISTVIGRNLHEQLKYVYELPTTAFTISIFMLRDRWDGLDEETKAAFWDAARWYDERFAAHVNREVYPEKYWPTVRDAGIESIQPSAEEEQRFRDLSREIWAWWREQVGEGVGQRAIDLALGRAA